MILMIDNFDSFTYNLVQYFQQLGSEVEVRRNNALTAGDALALRPEAIVLSPGPGRPGRRRHHAGADRARPPPPESRCSASASDIRRSGRRSAWNL